MNNIDKYIIKQNDTIRYALSMLNGLSGDSLVLLVVDDQKTLIGTLTDGDIRRGLIAGHELDEPVERMMHRDCMCLTEDEDFVSRLHELRERKITFVPVLDIEGRVVDIINLNKQHSFLPIDAVLMAGGKGERLRPLTDKTPKPLLQLGSKPIIDHIVEHILSYGIRNVSVTVNYLKEQLEEHFAKPFNGVQIQTVCEPKFLGTIGSMRYVKNLKNDTVLLMNSDAITDIDLEDYYVHFKEHGADMSVAAIPYTISVPYGILNLDGRAIKGVEEKPTYTYYANTGIYLIKRELLDLIPEGEFFNATDFMELLIEKGYNVIRFPLKGTWLDIGNPQEYQKAQDLVKHLKL